MTIRDYIAGEILEIGNKEKALKIANERLNKYREGYNVRRNHVCGGDAVLSQDGNTITISWKYAL